MTTSWKHYRCTFSGDVRVDKPNGWVRAPCGIPARSLFGPVWLTRMASSVSEAEAVAAGRQLAEGLVGAAFGSLRVRRAHVFFHEGSTEDQSALFLVVTLSDPKSDTWPVEDLMKLRRQLRHDSRQLNVPVPIFIELEPETDAVQADDVGVSEPLHLPGI